MLLMMMLHSCRSTYSHGRTTLLAIQVDAAINSGNSGGPVILGDHVVRGACLQGQLVC
jgi:S1-C subfamily serine protease